MAPPKIWSLSAVVSFWCLKPVFASVADDSQVFLGQEESTDKYTIAEELANLLQSSIWFEPNATDPSKVAFHCCNILNTTLPGQVFFPESPEYQAQQASYYSQEQSELSPSCRVSPGSAVDVSAIITFATKYACSFAVRSGGHMISKGYSNIDASGFTIDLQQINQISVIQGEDLVSFGAGCRWHEVYAALKPYNLTTVGGRAPDVGVSGFLLGVVLADGEIRDVNQQTLPDLYWALKYGSTNFAIVTRFDMSTYSLSEVWGGSLVFDISKAPALLQCHVAFTEKLTSDPMGLNVIALAWEPVQQTYVVWSPNIYLSPVAFPPLFADIQMLVPDALLNTMRITDLVSITTEFQAMAPGTGRVEWFTLTLKADAALLWDIHRKGVEIFGPYLNRTGFSWAVIFQPLNHGFAVANLKHGGDPSGISPEDGDLVLALGSALWSDPADDDIMKKKVHEHWQWSERTAHERNLLHPFIYMNYASGMQDVMGSIGAENQGQMRRIKNLYDPENRFGSYWKGGYKL
ncbi:hypothetical protein B0H11DRAFT_2155485 [Mycena galericulata]|nr:hypothetical protein B0H11DRAFT_2155485 [Mycena galericulata]